MFCSKCGAKLEDSNKFCKYCGNKIQVQAVDTNRKEETKMTMSTEKEPEIIVKTNDQTIEGKALEGKKSRKLIYVVAALALAGSILGTGMAVVPRMVNKSDEERVEQNKTNYEQKEDEKESKLSEAQIEDEHNRIMLYLTDDGYDVIDKMDGSAISTYQMAVCQDINIENSKNLVFFSKDGKYVFYFSQFSEDDGTGTLNRVEFDKLKPDSAENEKYIVQVDTNVRTSHMQIIGGKVAYLRGDDSLHWFDGTDSIILSENAESVHSDKEKYLMYISEGKLYGTSVEDMSRQKLIDENVSCLATWRNLDHVTYVKEYEDKDSELYTAGMTQEKTKIADIVDIFHGNHTLMGKTYYTVYNGKTMKLYDCVMDDSTFEDDKLRNELKDEKNALKLMNLYCWDNGKTTMIAEDVLAVKRDISTLSFTTAEKTKQCFDIKDIETCSGFNIDVINYFTSANITELDLSSGKQVRYMPGVYEKLEQIMKDDSQLKGICSCDILGNSMFIYGDEGGVYEADISDGYVHEWNVITEKGVVKGVNDETLYYVELSYDTSQGAFVNLYSAHNGVTKLCARDISYLDARVYEDGIIIARTSFPVDGGTQLCLYNPSGQETFIYDDVTDFERIDESTILFVAYDHLYCYKEGSIMTIADNVKQLWVEDSMKSGHLGEIMSYVLN